MRESPLNRQSFVVLMIAASICGCSAHSGSGAAGAPDIPDPSADNPVTAAAWLTPSQVSGGREMELHVRVRVAGGHYLHSTTLADSAFTATAVELQTTDALRSADGWSLPPADARGRLTGTLDFRRSVRAAESAEPGQHEIICILTYQACNDELCWPPRKLVLKTSFQIASK